MVLKGPRSTLLGTPSLVRGEIKIWLYLPSFPSPPLLHPSLFLTHRYTDVYVYICIVLSLPSLFTTCSFRPPLPPSVSLLSPSPSLATFFSFFLPGGFVTRPL